MQILYIIDYLIKTCTYRISVVTRVLAEKYIEDDIFVLPFFINILAS